MTRPPITPADRRAQFAERLCFSVERYAEEIQLSDCDADYYVAKACGIDPWEFFSRYMQGQAFPSVEILFVIEEYLGLTRGWLIYGDEAGRRAS